MTVLRCSLLPPPERVQSVAFATCAAAQFSQQSIFQRVGMPFRAFCTSNLLSNYGFPSEEIHLPCNRLKMSWIYASPHPAKVIQVEARGNGSDQQLVGETMSGDHTSRLPASRPKFAVTTDITESGPDPATILGVFVNLAPKSILDAREFGVSHYKNVAQVGG